MGLYPDPPPEDAPKPPVFSLPQYALEPAKVQLPTFQQKPYVSPLTQAPRPPTPGRLPPASFAQAVQEALRRNMIAQGQQQARPMLDPRRLILDQLRRAVNTPR